MKKRFLACGLCALMLLSAVRASAVRGEDVFHDDSVVRSVTTVVYCLSEDRYRLVPEVRTIQILGGETLLSVLANEVLQPSVSDNLVSAMSERARFAVLSVMQTGRVATVDLGGDADLLQIYELFCLKAALVNTLIETGLVDYVNVLIGGREVPTNDLPTGTMTRFSEDLQSAWVEHENEGVASLRSNGLYVQARRDALFYQYGIQFDAGGGAAADLHPVGFGQPGHPRADQRAVQFLIASAQLSFLGTDRWHAFDRGGGREQFLPGRQLFL